LSAATENFIRFLNIIKQREHDDSNDEPRSPKQSQSKDQP